MCCIFLQILEEKVAECSCSAINKIILWKERGLNHGFNRKEMATIEDLHTQELSCVEKYKRYGQEAKDPVLRDLFADLEKKEQKHVESLEQVMKGSVPSCNVNDRDGKMYEPKATYDSMTNPEDKKNDNFLATDSIGSEKMVSGTYNTDVFAFGDSDVRKLLADIQVEEQNHAEMLYKYKTVNGMA